MIWQAISHAYWLTCSGASSCSRRVASRFLSASIVPRVRGVKNETAGAARPSAAGRTHRMSRGQWGKFSGLPCAILTMAGSSKAAEAELLTQLKSLVFPDLSKTSICQKTPGSNTNHVQVSRPVFTLYPAEIRTLLLRLNPRESGYPRRLIIGLLIWNDLSTPSPLSSCHLQVEARHVSGDRAAVATVDHSDIRGSKPHGRHPSGATSD